MSDTIQLRPYQADAVSDVWEYWREGKGSAPLIVAPTGAGKSVIIAAIITAIRRKNSAVRIINATHVRELVEQNIERLKNYAPELEDDIGIMSGTIGGPYDMFMPIIYGTIQTLARRLDNMETLKPFDLLIIDEAHLLPTTEASQYRTFISWLREKNPNIRILGLTATPYRLDSGYLHEGEDAIFDGIAHDIGVKTLIDLGCLVTPKTKWAKPGMDVDKLKTRAGEFTSESQDETMNLSGMVDDALSQGSTTPKDRWLWFLPSVKSAHECADYLVSIGHKAEAIDGNLSFADRNLCMNNFREGFITHCCNVNIMTTGIDIPEINHVVLARATKSTSLYVQMCGRGLRPSQGKDACLVLDYGQNARRHGMLDNPQPTVDRKSAGKKSLVRHCKACGSFMDPEERVCPECGFVMPRRQVEFKFRRRFEGEMASWLEPPKVHEIVADNYKPWTGRSGYQTVRCSYKTDGGQWINEWICPEHPPDHVATRMFQERWRKTFNTEPPVGVDECIQRLDASRLKPARVTTMQSSGDKWPQISNIEYEEGP